MATRERTVPVLVADGSSAFDIWECLFTLIITMFTRAVFVCCRSLFRAIRKSCKVTIQKRGTCNIKKQFHKVAIPERVIDEVIGNF